MTVVLGPALDTQGLVERTAKNLVGGGDPSRLQLLHPVGQGASGTVYR